MVQCHLQAWLGIKIDPKETVEEVMKEGELEDVNKEKFSLALAEEEEESQRKWEVEMKRKIALDYYVDMALNNGGVPKNTGSKRKRKSDSEKGDGETRERKPRKSRK